ncbi:protein phosphatase [Bacillus pakistanensis]|uniref:Protein phosphatase n=1 Tax=Rossellomorea pakistanensis TaxID=992288 RepID=A0ABS2NFZ4_9BACI|nr:Stp1/IreP family PP2C-type Ser/Thr phosphatase [Bacillus pakistanensis]MBM7586785.1 protein phosphatase [Bacillus pakistanensis]
MKSIFNTDKGKIRQHNEDNGGIFLNQHGDYLAVVADGMGGHRAGDVASEMTVNFFKSEWELSDKIASPDGAQQWLNTKINEINQKVFDHSKEHEECEGMGTTLVAAVCTNIFVTIANIGDSRGYILNESGLGQLTEDHSLVNELVRSGQISREDAEHHPRKNVLIRALGTEEKIIMDLKTITFEEGDYLFLCSDGLSNKVSENEMLTILRENESLETKGEKLIALANDHGGEDNITLVIVEYAAEGESG